MGNARALALFLLPTVLAATELHQTTVADCTFVNNRDEFIARAVRARRDIAGSLAVLPRAAASRRPAAAIPRRSFIDEEIFGTLARMNVAPAQLTTDREFMRRVSLDLTGRIPSPDEVEAFVADTSPDKRSVLIDRLLYSAEFIERWTLWLGDLLQNTSVSTNINRRTSGRDAFHHWIRLSVVNGKSFKDIATEAVTATGNSFSVETGAVNYPLGATTPMGPAQDTYDAMLARAAGTFLGLAHYDCLLCHNGRGHLDSISLWAGTTTRAEAEQMAAFFSRLRLRRNAAAAGEPLYNSYDVTNAAAGAYGLNTTAGNRPPRRPVGTLSSLTPQYRLGAAPAAGSGWREAFAEQMVADPMFARNIANRLWKHFFGLGLVDPVDTLDPARLDPANPPPAPWTLQATHPPLLEALARQFVQLDFNMREFMRLLVESSAYQLSSRYEGEWKYESIPLFARHYPRRLEGEEVADAISKATGVPGGYAIGWPEPLAWAVQLPEPAEPRGGAAGFLNSFFRGNRDTQQRRQGGSILQQLNLMNDVFVLNRIRVASSPELQTASRLGSDEEVLDRIFLLFLSRRPTDSERERGLAYLATAGSPAARNAAIEDLAWVAINKVEFLFSY